MNNGAVKISVVLINFNSSAYTLECVQSIVNKTRDVPYEIIIVDNNSKDDDFERIGTLSDIHNVKIVRSRINLGFAGGNMLGVQNANPTSKYLFFLNNDCALVNDAIFILCEFMDSHLDVGAATAQMYDPQMRLQSSFGTFPSAPELLFGRKFLRLFDRYAYRTSGLRYTEAFRVNYVSGSALFTRAEHFGEIGGFDTNYFLFCEEEDLCMTMKRHGYSTWFVPAAEFIHFGGGSTKRNINIEKEFYISFLYFLRKHYSFTESTFIKLFYSLKLIRKVLRGVDYMHLAFFVLCGANMRHSLKFKQKIRIEVR